MTATRAKLGISKLWARFAPHFCKIGKTEDRIIAIPDEGGRLRYGEADFWLLPAHFLHSEGNFQFYDPVSKIQFSGDLGVSRVSGQEAQHFITSLSPMPPSMEAFHRRYMVGNKILRLWVRMVRDLDIAMVVPQQCAPLKGAAIGQLLDWLETLSCGIDLMGAPQYQLPQSRL